MFELNITDITQNLLSPDYYYAIYYVISDIVRTTYIELLIFTIGILFYAIFVWFFYRNLSKRDLFRLDLSRYDFPEVRWRNVKKVGSTLLYLLKYGIVFPFYVVFWFAVLSAFLFIMAKELAVRDIILISVALVSTVRITSYLKEDLSRDLAKLLPFALLAIFLIDPNFFSWDLLMARFGTIPSLGWEILKFLSFCIVLEWGLRILYSLKVAVSGSSDSSERQ